ncbi:hypothetical protein FGO68_gene9685 [Halteria grandinella]|uniref:Uncharacterized protein n=1 Tax=Halteria grandinella TaxID=5974 RepID=A0A8J8NMB4_HALGN|nr:hypothetical protein FGO68_gene9685 [Halteria grandinella]
MLFGLVHKFSKMVEQSHPHIKQTPLSNNLHAQNFRVKQPARKAAGEPNSYISEIVPEFVDRSDLAPGLHWGDVLCVQYDEHDRYVGASYSSGALKVLNSISGKTLHVLNPPQKEFDSTKPAQAIISAIKFKPHIVGHEKDAIIAVTSQGQLQYINMNDGKMLKVIDAPHHRGEALNCVDVNRTLEKTAIAGNMAQIHVYDEMSENKDFLMTLKAGGVGLPGHSKRIFSLKFDYGNENVLYSGGWDDAIYVNDLREGGAVGVVLGPHISGDAIDVKGNLLIAGSYRNERNLTLFDLRFPTKPLQHIDMDTSSINHFSECLNYAASFHPGPAQRILAAGCTGGRNEVKFFEASGDQDEPGIFTGGFKPSYGLVDFEKGVQCFKFSHKNDRVVVGTAGGLLAGFRMRVEKDMMLV